MPETITGRNGTHHPYYLRHEWGARAPRSRSRMGRHTRTFQHYTVTSAGGTAPSLAFGFASMRSVQAFHMDGRGWSDFAYTLGVDNAGRIYEGRGPGVTGGHTKGYNSSSYAVVWIGGPDDTPTPAAKSAIRAAHEWLDDLYNTSTRTDGHRDVAATGCPGDLLDAWVNAGMPIDGAERPKEWDEMATKAEVQQALKDVLAEAGIATTAQLEEQTLKGVIAVTGSHVRSIDDDVASNADLVNGQNAILATINGLGTDSVDVDALAAKLRDALGDAVADELAQRLAA